MIIVNRGEVRLDERFFYSIVLLVSMMFLCLLISPNDRIETQEKTDVIDLKSLLISQILYSKIITPISKEDESSIPLKIDPEQI